MNTLDLFGYVGDVWDGFDAASIAKDIQGHEGPLTVRINSPGGLAYDGIAIYNLLKPLNPKVEVIGLAASAASVIAMAGETVQVATGAEMMIHDAWGIEIGNAQQMRKHADDLDHLSDSIASIYAERSGKPADEMRALMAAETWLNGPEAIDAGLADEVAGERENNPEGSQALLAAMGCRTSLDAKAASAATRDIQRRYAIWRMENGIELTKGRTTA